MSDTVKVAKGENRVAAYAKREIGRVLALASLVVIFIFFTIMRPVFASWENVSDGILMSTVVIGLMAIGTTFVIITGGIDLSIGTTTALVAVIVGKLVQGLGLNVWAGILVGIVVGGICGHVAIAASGCENRTYKHRSGHRSWRRGTEAKQQHRRRGRSWFRTRCSELPMAPKVSQQGGHSGEGGREGGHEGGSHWCQRGAT